MDKETITVSDKTKMLLSFINLFLNFLVSGQGPRYGVPTLISEKQDRKCSPGESW